MKRKSARYIAFMAVFTVIALMFSYVESFIPMPIAGAKIGLANVVTLLVLFLFGFWDALILLVARIALATFLFSPGITFIYSAAGGFLGLLSMFLLHKLFKDNISLIAISITGAIMHNIGQLAVAMMVIENTSLWLLLPQLIIIAIPAGIIVGAAARYTLKHLKASMIFPPRQ